MTNIVFSTFAFVAILVFPLILICASESLASAARIIGIWVIVVVVSTLFGVFLYRNHREGGDFCFGAIR